MISLMRQSYARVFNEAVDDIGTLPMSKVSASVYDKRLMPALALEPGKSTFYTTPLSQNSSVALEFPSEWDTTLPLYVAIWTTGPLIVTKVDSLGGTGRSAVIATESDAAGVHYGLWNVQERDITSISIAAPSTANGGYDCEVKVFMYEIPDLTVADSYVDNVVGLGVTGT
jgi:hypothetical protein